MNATQLLAEHFRTIKADPEAWRKLFASDAVLEMPYAPAHVPSVLKGIDAIAQSVGGFFSQFSDFNIEVKKIYRIEGEDAAIAEFAAKATVIPTGKTYNQDYILYMRAENGKIARYREYFDGSRIVAAFTPDSAS
ncbi:MAG: nuclear transport factor 2 family protein [Burkholderia gladioli]